MKPKHERRKCAGCKHSFLPDPRSQHPQEFCARAKCRAASKAESQRKWAAKPKNEGYWRGQHYVDNVRLWRAKNPGYWKGPGRARKRTLQEHKLPDDPVIAGIIAVLAGSTLQEQIERTYRALVAQGREILRTEKAARGKAAAPARTPVQQPGRRP